MKPDTPVTRAHFESVLAQIQERACKVVAECEEHLPMLFFYRVNGGRPRFTTMGITADASNAPGIVRTTLSDRAADLVVLVHEARARVIAGADELLKQAPWLAGLEGKPQGVDVLIIALYSRDTEVAVVNIIKTEGGERAMTPGALPPEEADASIMGNFSIHSEG